jgi:hypothetical protein
MVFLKVLEGRKISLLFGICRIMGPFVVTSKNVLYESFLKMGCGKLLEHCAYQTHLGQCGIRIVR